jgi:hypothetical protein
MSNKRVSTLTGVLLFLSSGLIFQVLNEGGLYLYGIRKRDKPLNIDEIYERYS